MAKMSNTQLYVSLMEEAKVRLHAIDTVLNRVNGKYIFHQAIAQEIAYLQLRMLCEVIALSCLVAHGFISGLNLKRARDKYEADYIIKELEKLHPNFYPQPIVMTMVPNGINTVLKKEGFLTKKELLKLYREAGGIVHRGKVRNVETNPLPTVDFAAPQKWANKIVELLSQHRIASPDNTKHWMCTLVTGIADGPVNVGIFDLKSGRLIR